MSRIRANTITNQNANGAPNFPDGITVTGVVTATTTSQNITGDLTVTGNVGVGGTITYEDVTNVDSVGIITARDGLRVTGIATIGGNVLPATDNSHDLGSTSKRWANVHVGDMKLSNEGSSNDVDGSWGSYVIQEGENDLFLINNRNGKKYKFNLTEVN